MGSKNKTIRQKMETIYGKGCMFKRAHIPERLKGLRIKGYRVFVNETRYKLIKIKMLESTMTYHHLKHRSEGGRTDIENGAVISIMAHRYLHSLPRDQEEVINNLIREFKQGYELRGGIVMPTESTLEMQKPFQIQIGEDIEADCITLPAFDYTDNRSSYNRAKFKRDTQRFIESELSDLDYDDLD